MARQTLSLFLRLSAWGVALFACEVGVGIFAVFSFSSGLAVAAFFKEGRPAVFPVFLAAWCSYLYRGHPPVLSFSLSVILTATAFLTHSLLARFIGPKCALERRREFYRYLLLAGPLPYLGGTILMVLAYRFHAYPMEIPPVQLWVRLALGPLALLPPLLSLLALTPQWRKRWWPVGFPIAVLIALAFFARFLIHQQFHRYQDSVIQNEVTRAVRTIQAGLADRLSTLRAIQAYIDSSEDVTADEFIKFNRELSEHRPAAVAILRFDFNRPTSEPTCYPSGFAPDLANQPELRSFVDELRELHTPQCSPLIIGFPSSPGPVVFLGIPVTSNKVVTGCLVGAYSVSEMRQTIELELEGPTKIHLSQKADKADFDSEDSSYTQESFEFLDREWFLSLGVEKTADALPRWGLPIGIVVSILLDLILLVLSNRASRIESLKSETEDRARSLQKANQELRRMSAEVAAADQAKNLFLANISHEIRTPMNAILGLARLALDSDLKPAQREQLKHLECSAEALMGTLNAILDFSKLETGEVRLHPSFQSLSVILEETTRTFALSAEEKGLELILDIAPELPDRILVDGNRLRQILLNLLSNAVKFTKEGEVCLVCRGAFESPGRFRYDFSVRDTGIGVAESKLESIFGAFAQGDVSASGSFYGAGLGLSIATGLLQLMESDLKVESELGSGSNFYFSLSLECQAEERLSFSQAIVPERIRVYLNVSHPSRRKSLLEQACYWGFDRAETVQEAELLIFDEAQLPNYRSAGKPAVAILRISELSQTLERCLDSGVTPLIAPVSKTNLHEAISQALAPKQSATPDSEKSNPEYGGLRVLLVDDSDTNRLVAMSLLERFGFAVEEARDGKAAVRRAKSRPFDLILMDIRMPLQSGLEAAYEIRQSQPEIPIIGATAQEGEKGWEQVMDVLLIKPYSASELRRVLDLVLKTDRRTFDPSCLYGTVGQDREAAVAVISSLLEDLPVWLPDMETGNTTEVRTRASHSMAPALKAVGAAELARKTLKFQKLTADGLDSEAGELLQSLVTDLESLRAKLQSFLERQP